MEFLYTDICNHFCHVKRMEGEGETDLQTIICLLSNYVIDKMVELNKEKTTLINIGKIRKLLKFSSCDPCI